MPAIQDEELDGGKEYVGEHDAQSHFVEHQQNGNVSNESQEIKDLSPEHREYLLKRHGTLDLEPVPDMTDADPLNWKQWKKVVNLILVAFHAMMGTFTAASIQSSFENIAMDFKTSIQRVSYLTSLQIAIIGVVPLLWRPLADRYGRRPIFIISLICSLVGNVGCAESHSYSAMGVCRAIVAFFICPAGAIGSAVVAETFFRRNRARYMGIWTLMVTLGVPLSPFLFGFVSYRVDYRWIYWVLAITNGVQLILYIFFGPETLYMRKRTNLDESAVKQSYLKFRRIDPTPLTLMDFVKPLFMAARPRVMIPACAYAMVFNFAGVLISIMIPQLFAMNFHFNSQQVGLQYLSMIVGGVIGELLGGFSSDIWMSRRRKQIGHSPAPEWRLWLSYPGYLLAIIGTVVFLVQIGNAGHVWNITPLVGAAIASVGNQIVTTVLITYAVDCYREEAAHVGVFITLVRQVWSFIGPFYFTQMINNLGLGGSAGLIAGLIVAVSFLPTIPLQWKGQMW